MSLIELIEKCKKNDRKAQFQLYEMEYNSLMRMAFRYKTNEEDAAELVNLAFFKILTNLDKFNPELSFGAWTKRILSNTIIDEFRKSRKFSDNISLEDTSQQIPIDHSDFDIALERESVSLIMGKLNEEERVIFNLYEVEGYAHKEIAEMLTISERTSKRYLAKAKINLKEIVSEVLKPENIAI